MNKLINMFQTDELKSKWDEWILERKDRKIKKYTERGEKAAKTHLLAISQNNESIAVKIIEQSIAQGWTGLFPLKNYTNGISTTGASKVRNRPETITDGNFGSL